MEQSGLSGIDDMSVDTENLYREESITDLKSATIRQLIPINIDGSEDSSRSRQFIGDTTLMYVIDSDQEDLKERLYHVSPLIQ